MSNLGIRGGHTISLDQAERLMRDWKAGEFGWLQARVLMLAAGHGEFHGDMLEDVHVSERNMIGAVTGTLVRHGLLQQSTEHRASRAPASHGRRSYVYLLTERGRDLVFGWPAEMQRIAEATEPLDPPQGELF